MRGRKPKGTLVTLDEMKDLLELWNRGVASPHGIRITSMKPNYLMQRLYAARRECGHDAYHGHRLIETETEVWMLPR